MGFSYGHSLRITVRDFVRNLSKIRARAFPYSFCRAARPENLDLDSYIKLLQQPPEPTKCPISKIKSNNQMDIDVIKSILDLAIASGMAEIEMATEGSAVKVVRRRRAPHQGFAEAVSLPVRPSAPDQSPPQAAASSQASKRVHTVTSLLIGRIHLLKDDGTPFAPRGALMRTGDSIGIVVALGITQKVAATDTGEVIESLVDHLEPVEYGQPLLRLLSG